MQVKDLDRIAHNWHLTGNMAHGKVSNRSGLHLRARELITNHFPTLQILEEVPIALRRGETLYLDFYLPLKKLCVEVHGEQHYKFVGFYHTSMLNFLKSQRRDGEKQEWCEINNITHIVFPHYEDSNDWLERIKNA